MYDERALQNFQIVPELACLSADRSKAHLNMTNFIPSTGSGNKIWHRCGVLWWTCTMDICFVTVYNC